MRTLTLALLLLLISVSAAQSTQPTDSAQTPIRIQTLRGSDHFLYGEKETTTGELGQTIRSLIKPLQDARAEGKVQYASQLIVTMTDLAGIGPGSIKVRAGYLVRPDTTAPDGFTLGQLESQRAATTIFSGPPTGMRDAFVQLYQELAAAGLEPTGERRQMILYYEGPESENNVYLLQVLVK